MTTIEPPSTNSVPAQNLGAPSFALLAKGGLSSEARPSSSTPFTNAGAPYLDSEMWASSEGRPSFFSLKRTLLACLLVLATTLHAQSPNWQLTWSDEFNGPNGSPPDPAKWVIVNAGNGFGNSELETYTGRPVNIQQQDGDLVITAQKENLTGPDGIPRHYTSARINTHNHFAQKYGRIEARIQLPVGKGIWPAFWLLGDNHETAQWPACGEIDILETIGAPDIMYSTIHGPGYSGGKGISAKFPLPPGESVQDTFHLYAVEWAPNDIKFFFDDHLIVHRTPADLPPNTRWVYDHPFYLLLNLAVGGRWPGSPDNTTVFPQRMLVDYVRVYKPREPERASSSTPPHASTSNLSFPTNPGAPHLDSEMWASSAGRPSLNSGARTPVVRKPTQ
jgi:beta-glucanase (GH16 family)